MPRVEFTSLPQNVIQEAIMKKILLSAALLGSMAVVPAVAKPSAELLAELLIRMNKPAEAIPVLRDQLTHTPGRTAIEAELRDAAKLAGDIATEKAAEDVLSTNLHKNSQAQLSTK
jgi:hypothetical protein